MTHSSCLLKIQDHSISQMSVRGFLCLRGENALDMQPDYQRGYVWTLEQQKKLIDSFLRRLPVPAIYLVYKTRQQVYEVFDGKQRLSSIFGFIDGKFCTEEGQYYCDFTKPEKLKFEGIVMPLCELRDPTRNVLLDYFQRINTSGTTWQQNF